MLQKITQALLTGYVDPYMGGPVYTFAEKGGDGS